MSSISFDYNTAVVGSIFRSVPDLFGNTAKAVRTYFARQEAEKKLLALDDRQLADIGIERADIHRVVWNGR